MLMCFMVSEGFILGFGFVSVKMIGLFVIDLILFMESMFVEDMLIKMLVFLMIFERLFCVLFGFVFCVN